MIQAMKHLFYLFFFVTDSSRQLKMSYHCKRIAVNLPGHSKTETIQGQQFLPLLNQAAIMGQSN